MNRLFGTSAPRAPKPTLTSAITNLDARISALDVKLASINAEFSGYQYKLAKMRDGPGKAALKNKALNVLRRRKQYEQQRETLQAQVWNMEQAQMNVDNLNDTKKTMEVLQDTTKSLRRNMVDPDKVARLQDEMEDLLEVGKEIQESLARSYDVPEDVDEAELDAELEALGEEADYERELAGGIGNDALPSFMQDEVPEFIDEAPSRGKVREVASG